MRSAGATEDVKMFPGKSNHLNQKVHSFVMDTKDAVVTSCGLSCLYENDSVRCETELHSKRQMHSTSRITPIHRRDSAGAATSRPQFHREKSTLCHCFSRTAALSAGAWHVPYNTYDTSRCPLRLCHKTASIGC